MAIGLALGCASAVAVILGVSLAAFPAWTTLAFAAVLGACCAFARPQVVIAANIAMLVLLSYGYNSIGVLGIPLAILVTALCGFILLAIRHGGPIESGGLLFVPLAMYVGIQVLAGVQSWGVLAVRDGLFLLDLLGLVIGARLVVVVGWARLRDWIGWLMRIAAVWYSLIVAKPFLVDLGPEIAGSPVVSFTGALYVPLIAFVWFLYERRKGSVLWATLALFDVLVAQARMSLLLLPALLILGILLASGRRRTMMKGVKARIVAVMAILAMALVVGPSIPGRLGADVGVDSIVEQVASISGDGDGIGAGSASDRYVWWSRTWHSIHASAENELFGQGYGRSLVPEVSRSGSEIRKPHNDYLELWARSGLIGLLLFLIPLGAMLGRAWRLGRGNRIEMARFPFLALVVLLGTALVQPFIAFSYGALPIFVLLGIASQLHACQIGKSPCVDSTRSEATRVAPEERGVVRH